MPVSVSMDIDQLAECIKRDLRISVHEKGPLWDPGDLPPEFSKRFIGPSEEVVVAESGRRDMRDLQPAQSLKRTVYVRAGPDIFLDSDLQHAVSGLPDQKPLIFLDMRNGISALPNDRLVSYTILATYALHCTGLENRYVLDLGSGDGTLGLVAKKLGAQEVYSIDNNPLYGGLLRSNVRANNMDLGAFTFVCGDIQQNGTFRKIPKRQISVVMANIGPHYGGSDIAAIKSLNQFPDVQAFIGGGYVAYENDSDIEEYADSEFFPDRKYSPRSALSLLDEIGFSHVRYVIEEESTPFSFGRRLAFIASKQ